MASSHVILFNNGVKRPNPDRSKVAMFAERMNEGGTLAVERTHAFVESYTIALLECDESQGTIAREYFDAKRHGNEAGRAFLTVRRCLFFMFMLDLFHFFS